MVGIREDIPQTRMARAKVKGEEFWVHERYAQRFSGRWSCMNSECCKIKQEEEGKEIMSTHLVSPLRPQLRNLDSVLRTIWNHWKVFSRDVTLIQLLVYTYEHSHMSTLMCVFEKLNQRCMRRCNEEVKITMMCAGVVQDTSDSLGQGGIPWEEKQQMDSVYSLISIPE